MSTHSIEKQKLSQVLRLDAKKLPRSMAKLSLANILGDTYLLEKNPVYRRVRKESLRRKIRFTDLLDPLSRSCGLLSIHPMYERKTVYFQPNRLALHEIERLAPKRFRLEDIQGMGVKQNSLVHESTHLCWFSDHFGSWKKLWSSRLKLETTLAIQVGESLAVAAECMSQTHVSDPAHEFFLAQNLFTYDVHPRIAALKRLSRRAGPEFAMRITFLSLLYSNFLYAAIDEEQVDRLVRMASLGLSVSKTDQDSARELAPEILDRLSAGFRLGTAQLYFAMLGHKKPVTTVLSHDPLQLLEKNLPMLKQAFALIQTLVKLD